ncbi:Non-classical export protein [Lachnellula subtilissima]|uniref:Non-classical export protein n=1 Tax=Lachnellula subtilissima TaxID=602034 RepID=A0A8H8RFF6_9HELO|nr:Non-classical export protein [Lachnellula subtilissima]
MAGIPQMALRAWTFLWTLLALSLIGNVIASAFSGNPSVVNYAMFVSVFCMLVVLFGIAGVFVESLAIPIALAVADVLAALFSVIAGIALAAELHVHSCGNQRYLLSNHLTNGSHNMGKRCHELQASTAFFWFMFVGFAGSAVFDLIGSGTSLPGRGGMRKGGPSMSQV